MENTLGLLNDEKRLKKELIFASLFVMAYESFVSNWKENILGFFANSHGFHDGKVISSFCKPTTDSKGNMVFIPDKKAETVYRKRVYQRIKKTDGNNDTDLSMFDFMVEFGLIDKNDYKHLIDIRKIRNLYSHELVNVLFDKPPANTRELFSELIRIRKKASEFWIREVEIPTSPDEEWQFNEQGKFVDPEWVASTQDLFFDVIITNAMKENDESK